MEIKLLSATAILLGQLAIHKLTNKPGIQSL